MHCWYPFKIHDLLSAASSTERCWLWCKVMTSCEGGFHAGRCKLVYLSVHRPLVIGGVCNTFSLLDCLLGGTREIPHTFVFFQLCLGLLPLYCHTRLFFFSASLHFCFITSHFYRHKFWRAKSLQIFPFVMQDWTCILSLTAEKWGFPWYI